MKELSQLLSKQKIRRNMALDDKSVFYIFDKIIEREYGRQGKAQLKADYYKDSKIFIKAVSSHWASELWLNKAMIIQIMNEEFGFEAIKDIMVK